MQNQMISFALLPPRFIDNDYGEKNDHWLWMFCLIIILFRAKETSLKSVDRTLVRGSVKSCVLHQKQVAHCTCLRNFKAYRQTCVQFLLNIFGWSFFCILSQQDFFFPCEILDCFPWGKLAATRIASPDESCDQDCFPWWKLWPGLLPLRKTTCDQDCFHPCIRQFVKHQSWLTVRFPLPNLVEWSVRGMNCSTKCHIGINMFLW